MYKFEKFHSAAGYL